MMGTVKPLADAVARGLTAAPPGLRKTVVCKLSLAVGAMIEGQTPNTVARTNRLPLNTERQDRREPWLRRLLKNPLRLATAVMAPFAREALAKAARNGPTVRLSMDQTDLGDRMAVLMVALRVGDRALPLAWLAEEGPTNIGFAGQQPLLEQVLAWLPTGAKVRLSADRFYPSADLFGWLHAHGWGYRRRRKGHRLADPSHGDATTTGALARGAVERYLSGVRLFAQGVMTHVGILHAAGHPEPWLIAIDCTPTRAAVLNYALRWAIEPLFSDVKGRGFELADSPLWHADRLERWVLVMARAMHGYVRVGQDAARRRPTPLETKHTGKVTLATGVSGSSVAAWCLGLPEAYVA